MKVLLVGPQGSGKSTQAKLLAEYLNIPTVETGQIFRDLSEDETKLGKRIKGLISKGEMVDDDTTRELVKKRVAQDDCQDGFVMNGYPRSLRQLEIFDPGFDKVFYLVVSDQEVKNRLLKRGREDDTEEGINKRLELYYQMTEPMLEHYKNSGILEEINGVGEIADIQKKLREKVNG